MPVLLIVILDACQVTAESCGGQPARSASDLPQRRLIAAADRAGLPVLDLLPAFRDHRARTGERLYYLHDIHWNEAGHTLAARLVADALAPRLR